MPSEIDPLKSTGYVIRRVSHALHVRVNQTFEAEGIPHSVEEMSILTVLDQLESPERIGILADLLGREISTLTRQLDGLVKAGLVARKRCPEDGRAVVASITPTGKKLVQRVMPLIVDIRKRVQKGIPKADDQVLVRTLFKMLDNLRDWE